MSDERRGTSAERGYGYRWQIAREAYLEKHPLCEDCQARGHVVPATVVDHKVPHRGDMKLFWDSSNWQGLCDNCHSMHKQRQENSGVVAGCDEEGMPLDPNHHWRGSASGEGG